MSTKAPIQPLPDGRYWYDIAPKDAVDLALPPECAPLNEMDEPCPWPWDPEQLGGQPIGMYHCGYCGAMAVAGMKHPDYRDEDDTA